VSALAVVLLLAACGSSASKPSTSTTTRPRATTTTTGGGTTSTTVPTTDAVLAPPLLPLFPFQTTAEAQAWMTAHAASGARPEFADPGTTALAFAHFLGYDEIDRVTATNTDAKGAHVSVGFLVPDTQQARSAAVVHLVRALNDAAAPWEVVGTDDTTFALTRPAYGAPIRSPLAVGGTITGVDESIRVQVRQLHAGQPLGGFCCIPAGSAPWSGTVTFTTPSDPVLMVAASTGGHVRRVERFTVNGVRAAT
jgi:hypothetical protein